MICLLRKGVFILTFFSQGLALAGPCEEVAFSDVNSWIKAMTEGLVLREGQDSLMNFYLTRNTPYPRSDGGHTLSSVLSVLNRHPELKKPRLREQILEFPITERTSPESLKIFVRSFTRSAGQIRNNLFQISANLGFWMKLLDFRSLEITNAKPLSEIEVVNPPLSPVEISPPTQGKSAKKTLKKQQQEDFIKWLNTTPLNQETRDFIKDTSKPYWERTVTLYRALEEIRKSYRRVGGDNNPVVQRIGQAMADLVHTVGFGNESLKARLKSTNPIESYSALKDILNERDMLAFDLGFEGHFKELKEALDSKIADETKILQQIHQDIQNQPSSLKGKEVLRLRSLSLQESPFRSCLGADCASKGYFEKALDPNFLYFTLTDSQHRSFGHVTVVLGEAKNNQGLKIKVGFVDKIQGVSLEKLKPMLEGIRLTLKEEGYTLALPKKVGDPNTGLANDQLIGSYVEFEIGPKLKKSLKNFKPHKHKYQDLFSKKGYSRSEDNLPLLVFEGIKIQGVEIKAGPVHRPQIASPSLSVRSLYEPILSLKESTKEADQLKFLSHLLNIHGVRELDISDKYVRDHLHFVLNNKDFSFKIRKQAFYTLLEFSLKQDPGFLFKKSFEQTDPIDFFNKLTAVFSAKEKQIIIGEMSNWKNTTDYRKEVSIGLSTMAIESKRDLLQILDSPEGSILNKGYILWFVIKGYSSTPNFNYLYKMNIVKTLLDRGADVNYQDTDSSTALMWASKAGLKEITSLLLKAGADINVRSNKGDTALIFASHGGHKEIVPLLLKAGADINIRNNEGDTALYEASYLGYKEIVPLLLEAKADLNIKYSRGKTALIWASLRGHKEVVSLLLKAKADVNVRDNEGDTALIGASLGGYKEIVSLLLKAGADVNVRDNRGNTALIWASRNGYKEIVPLLLKAGADINIRNNEGHTALMMTSIFVYEGGKEVASQLLKARAETKGIKNKIAIIWDKIILARDFVKDQF